MKQICRSLTLTCVGAILFQLIPVYGGSCNSFGIKEKSAIKIYFDADEPAIAFAADDLKEVLLIKGAEAKLYPLSDLPPKLTSDQIVLTINNSNIIKNLKKAGAAEVGTLAEQEYALRITKKGKYKSYWAIGGDRIGAMYGAIHIGEIIKAFGIEAMEDGDHSPYISKRGIKFNIPLGDRQPSHDDRGTSAQTNIVHMWDMDFWTEYLDLLAKQRYNVLSLWNQHPFPSMIKLEEYPLVALDDVYNRAGKVKDMTIDEKIEFWKRVMDYAFDRGIEVYIITWNIHMHGARSKHGIRSSYKNEPAKKYLRQAVTKLFQTYPRLSGIGVTAGENMLDLDDDEKEAWLWETYGKGIQDYHKIDPERNIRFIHRYWQTSFDKIDSRFGQLKNGYDMSFKYAKARIYSSYHPGFAEKELFPNIPEDMATWWNIRNDDIFNLRWGDPEYVRQFILNFPEGKRTAGYYMGSDRFAWGRESISLNPTSPCILENEKHWYSFLLWGRLGYDPETPDDFFKALIADRFQTVSSEKLFSGWKSASEIIPLVNRFHWFAWDYLWWPEAGVSSGSGDAIPGYHDINHFINAPVMPESGLLNIVDYSEAVLQNKKMDGKTPLEVASMLEGYSNLTMEEMNNMDGGEDNELSETIGDIKAMAHLGNYYAKKIRGAAYLKLYQDSKKEEYKTKAIANLEESLFYWRDYGKTLARQYIKMNIAFHRVFDWDKIEIEVKEDVNIAKAAK